MRRMQTRKAGVLIAPALVLVLAVSISAPAAQADEPRIDKESHKLLVEMGDFLAAHEEFSLVAEVTSNDAIVGTHRVHTTDMVEAVVRRPNKLWIDTQGDLFSKRFWYNGSTATVFAANEKFYSMVEVAAEIGPALDQLVDDYGVTTPVADFLYSRPYDLLIAQVETGVYAGIHRVNGVACHHLSFTQGNVDWEIWIDAGRHPVPRKLVVRYKNESGSPVTSTVFKEWDFSTKHPDSLFEFEAPESAVEIEFLVPEQS